MIHEKTYALQTAHGLHFGLSPPQTNDWLQRLQPVLATALERAGYALARDQERRSLLYPVRASIGLILDSELCQDDKHQDGRQSIANPAPLPPVCQLVQITVQTPQAEDQSCAWDGQTFVLDSMVTFLGWIGR